MNSIADAKFEIDTFLRFPMGFDLGTLQNSINSYRNSIDKIAPSSQEKFDELKKKIQSVITELEGKLLDAKSSKKKDLIARIDNLKDAQRELKIIEDSDTTYSFDISDKPYFEVKDNIGTINYSGSLGSLLNELKHTFQYETGQIDFLTVQKWNRPKVFPGLLYDIHDELETYKRQYALDGILKLNITLDSEQITQDIKSKLALDDMGTVEITKMKQIKVSVIIKIADSFVFDGLYETISKKELNRNSTMKDVIKGNRKRNIRKNHLSFLNVDKKKQYMDYVKVFVDEKVSYDVKF